MAVHVPVELDVEGDGLVRGLDGRLRDAKGRFAKAGQESGGAFGIGFTDGSRRSILSGANSIISGFGASLQGGIVRNPAIISGIATGIAAAMPLAGTLAAGSFTTAFGAGIAGLGLVFAAQNERVRSAFSSLGSDIAATMREISRPLQSTLLVVADVARDVFNSFVPFLADAFSGMAPVISNFVRATGEALKALGPTISVITDSFNGILGALGSRMPGIIGGLARSFANMATSVDPNIFAGLVAGLFKLVEVSFNAIAALSRLSDNVLPALRVLGSFLGNDFVQAFLASGAVMGVVALAIAGITSAITAIVGPVALIVGGLALLSAAFVRAYQSSLTFRAFVQGAFTAISAFFTNTFLPAMRAVFAFFQSEIMPIILGTAASVRTSLQPVFQQLVTTFRKDILPALIQARAKFIEWWPVIRLVANAVAQAVAVNIRLGAAVLGRVLPPLIRLIGFIIGKVIPATLKWYSTIARVIVRIGQFAIAIGRAISAAARFAASAVSSIGRVVSAFVSLSGRVIGAVAGLATSLYAAGRNLIQGMINGVTSMASSLASKARSVVQGAINAARRALGIKSPSRVFAEIGRETVRGFVEGIDTNARDADAATRRMMTSVSAIRPRAGATPDSAGIRADGTAVGDVAGGVGVQVNQNFYGPTTSGGRLRELDWTLRYATIGRREAVEGVAL